MRDVYEESGDFRQISSIAGDYKILNNYIMNKLFRQLPLHKKIWKSSFNSITYTCCLSEVKSQILALNHYYCKRKFDEHCELIKSLMRTRL